MHAETLCVKPVKDYTRELPSSSGTQGFNASLSVHELLFSAWADIRIGYLTVLSCLPQICLPLMDAQKLLRFEPARIARPLRLSMPNIF